MTIITDLREARNSDQEVYNVPIYDLVKNNFQDYSLLCSSQVSLAHFITESKVDQPEATNFLFLRAIEYANTKRPDMKKIQKAAYFEADLKLSEANDKGSLRPIENTIKKRDHNALHLKFQRAVADLSQDENRISFEFTENHPTLTIWENRKIRD